MSVAGSIRTVLVAIYTFVCLSDGQSTGNNVPSSPMWPLFTQLLSTQTGRTVQDLNTLGLSDPTINQLWTSYSASLAKMTQTPTPKSATPTTPPPLPDLYQNSYSFSSSSSQAASNQAASNQAASNQAASNQAASNQAASSGSAKSKSPDNTVLYNDILNLINQLSAPSSSQGPSAPQRTATTAQDVMNAYAQLSGTASNSGSATTSNSNPTQAILDQLSASTGTSAATGGTDYQALVQQYLAATGGKTNSGNSGTSTNAAPNSAPSYQSLMDQYNSIMNQGSSASSTASGSSYEQLLQQYNQIMGSKSAATSSSNSGGTAPSAMEQYMALLSGKGSPKGTPTDQLLQMYAQMTGGKTSNASAAILASATGSAQETFDKQLATFFPQFKSLFPQSSTGNTTASANSGNSASGSDPTAGNTAQMIFDAILFAPPQPAAGGASTGTTSQAETSTPSPQEAAPQVVQNLVNSGAGAEAALSNHVQNVFKTRASREMGCRFLPELLELDVLATAPINCMNRCPFPYVNSQQFGMYCVCCPPGVNEQTVGMMSLVRGSSYMETPLAVVS